MRRSTTISIIVAMILIVVGFCFMYFGAVGIDFDFSRLNTLAIETNTYKIENTFDSIKINTSVCDVVFLPTEKEYCEVVFREESKMKHSVKMSDNTLVIDYTNNKKWYDNIGIFWGKTDITVYLPDNTYKDVKIETNTGDVELKGFSFENLLISTNTGDVELKGFSLESLLIFSDTGDVEIADVETRELSAETETGDVSLKKVYVRNGIDIKTDTGDVEINIVK